jgi:DNA-binding LytR/AlgR family response regulator
MIKQYDPGYKVTAVIDSVEAGVEWFMERNEDPDLILMDIQLTDGNSFEMFNRLKIDIPVVFITAFDEFAIRAFKVNSIDYLLKPLDFVDLKAALDKYNRLFAIRNRPAAIDYSKLANLIRVSFRKRFLVKKGDQLKQIETDQVSYFTMTNGIVFAHLLNGEKSLLEMSLDDINQSLDPDLFFRVSRQTIVSVHAINKILNYFNRRLLLHLKPDNKEVFVSRERVNDFKRWVDR